MKAYIILVTILITVGILFVVGQLDGALDGEEMNTYTLLLGGMFFFTGLQIGLMFFPFHKEEVQDALRSWFNDEECPEEAEEDIVAETKDLSLLELGYKIQELSMSFMEDLEPMTKQPEYKEDVIVNARAMGFVFCCYQGASCVIATEEYDNLPSRD